MKKIILYNSHQLIMEINLEIMKIDGFKYLNILHGSKEVYQQEII